MAAMPLAMEDRDEASLRADAWGAMRLLPLAWSEGDLGDALETAGAQAVVTQALIGEERPAELFCRVACRYFGLRFVCVFGPFVPDGVIDLDRIITDGAEPASSSGSEERDRGLVTFGRRAGPAAPIHRAGRSLVAAAVIFLIATRIGAGERVLTLLPPDDHPGLTGFAAALLSGATFECHGLFDSRVLTKALDDETPTHLIAPGWLEASIAEAGLDRLVASTVLVHAAPIRFKAKTLLKRNVVDVLAFDETALVARARDARGQLALSIGDEDGQAATRNLLQIRRDGDGMIFFAGLAADVQDFKRFGMAHASDESNGAIRDSARTSSPAS
jgi:mycobactin salicyl-AMP ligase